MNKFGKFCAIALGCIAGLGVIGGACYNYVPSFKNRVDNIFNISTSANIGNSEDENLNGIKPITPEEFKSTYKFELPTTFLGGKLFVKPLSNGNLLVSSSVCTSILVCDIETNTTKQEWLGYSNWQYFNELSNGDCLISSSETGSGVLLFSVADNSITLIAESVYSVHTFCELDNGDCVFTSSIDSYGQYVYIYKAETKIAITITTDYKARYISICLLKNGNCLLSGNMSSSGVLGLYLLDVTTDTVTRIYTSGYGYIFYPLSNGNYLGVANNSTSKIVLYNPEDSSVIEISDSYYTLKLFYEIGNGKYLLSFNTSSSGLFAFDTSDNSLTQLLSTSYAYTVVNVYNDRILLKGYSGVIVDYNIENNIATEIDTLSSSLDWEILSNGNIFFYCTSTTNSFTGLVIFNYSECTLTKIYTSGINWQCIEELPNGDCLIGGSTNGGLLYYDATDCTVKLVLSTITVTSITAQEDGTYLITTSDDYDYEYNPETDTVKLIYTVEQTAEIAA